jgi:hypothetical protein
MEKLETELASLRARAETLSDRHAAADAAFLDAKSKLRRHLMEADLATEEKAGAKLEAAVAACAQTRDALADALGEVRKMIAATEQKVAAEREAVARAKAAEKLKHDLDQIERALPDYLEAARRLADALESMHYSHYESTEMAAFIRNGQAQVEIAAAFALQELRATVELIKTGAAPIPREERPEPVAATEAAPETRRLFALRSIKWRDDAEGRQQRYGLQYQDHDLPIAAAMRGLRIGAVVPLTDPRRKQLLGSRGGHHVNPNAVDILDLDDEAATRPPHLQPILASDPVAQANITPFDRGVPERKLSTAGPRV